MSETKFTPGPWRIEPIFGEGDLSIVLGYDIPTAGRPLMVAHVIEEDDHGFCPVSKTQGIANARLIAAAPDLYEAAVEAIRDRFLPVDGVIDKLRAAVRKAEQGA